MRIGNLIQIETNVWIVIREVTQHPKAAIHKINDTIADDRGHAGLATAPRNDGKPLTRPGGF